MATKRVIHHIYYYPGFDTLSHHGQEYQDETESDEVASDSDERFLNHRFEFEPPGHQLMMTSGRYAGIGPKGYHRSDERIVDDVCDRLMLHGELDARHIEVEIKDGVVALKGSVRDRKQKRLAETICDSVIGVKDVENRLKILGLETQPQVTAGHAQEAPLQSPPRTQPIEIPRREPGPEVAPSQQPGPEVSPRETSPEIKPPQYPEIEPAKSPEITPPEER